MAVDGCAFIRTTEKNGARVIREKVALEAVDEEVVCVLAASARLRCSGHFLVARGSELLRPRILCG